MYVLLAIACLLPIVYINGSRIPFFFDDTTYNPCGTTEGLYFYSHPTDNHQYYQCDEFGIAYLRSCGALVWDELRLSCNWESAVAPPAKLIPTPPTTTSSFWLITTLPTTSFTWPSTTTTSTTISVTPSSSLCAPVDPCGEHGVCVESPKTDFSITRRFACICTENWFGRLCDKKIDELTTPPSMALDQNKNTPVKLEKDPKLIFFGLKGNNLPEEPQPNKKR